VRSAAIAASVINAGTVMVTAIVSVPLIIERVGIAGFGAWTLALAVIAYASIIETGFGPSVQRTVAIAVGALDLQRVHRTLWTVLCAYALVGMLLLALLWTEGEWLAELLELQQPLDDEAREAYERLGVPVALAVLAAGLGSALQGAGRFIELAASTAIGAVVYLGSIFLLVGQGDVSDLSWAAALQYGVISVLRAVALRSLWSPVHAPRFLHRTELGEILGFSARLQPWAASELINSQSDKVVVGFVASATTVGYVGIGQQIADAGRLLFGAVLNPIQAAFAHLAGANDSAELHRRFQHYFGLWLRGVFGVTLILAASAPPLVVGWVGRQNAEAGIFAIILVLAAGCIWSTGVALAYLRVLGRVELEARFGLLVLAANVLLTVVLGLAAGPYGVVAGTLLAYAAGASYFFYALRSKLAAVPLISYGDALRSGVAATSLAAVSGTICVALAALVPSGFAVLPIGLVIFTASALYAGITVGVRPRVPVLAGSRVR
jgi:O-antigen/teichoic acid export membrane protein